MGWYIVRKKIKGNMYLYRQRTYREGGKVRTESQYLEPLPDTAEGSSDFNQESVDAIEKALKEARLKRDRAIESYHRVLSGDLQRGSIVGGKTMPINRK